MFLMIVKLIAVQIVVAAIVIVVLYKLLNKILIDTAIHKIETLSKNEIDQTLKDVQITAYAPLNEAVQQRILDAIFKKLERTTRLLISQDKKIRGGIIIKLNTIIVDCSLASRLKDAGIVK